MKVRKRHKKGRHVRRKKTKSRRYVRHVGTSDTKGTRAREAHNLAHSAFPPLNLHLICLKVEYNYQQSRYLVF